MVVDLDFVNITIAVFTPSGKSLKRFRTLLRGVLTHRIWVERIQRKYPRSWRFIGGVRESVKTWKEY